jgi:hypothetical protein
LRTKTTTLVALLLATLRCESETPDRIALKVAPGFAAEEIFAARESDGSWSAMTVDARGRSHPRSPAFFSNSNNRTPSS